VVGIETSSYSEDPFEPDDTFTLLLALVLIMF